jgi:hypothetical protein
MYNSTPMGTPKSYGTAASARHYRCIATMEQVLTNPSATQQTAADGNQQNPVVFLRPGVPQTLFPATPPIIIIIMAPPRHSSGPSGHACMYQHTLARQMFLGTLCVTGKQGLHDG